MILLFVLSSDDFSVYNGCQVGAQQKCLAHLRRHFKKVLKIGRGNNPQVAEAFLALIDEAFCEHRLWRETKNFTTYFNWAKGFKERLLNTWQTWHGLVGYAAGLLLKSLQEKAKAVVVLS